MIDKATGDDDRDVVEDENGVEAVADDMPAPDDGRLADDANDDAVFADVDLVADEPATAKRPSWFAALLGSVALLAAIGALAGVAYLAFFTGGDNAADEARAEQIAALTASIRANETALSDLERRFAELETPAGAPPIDAEAIERRIQQRVAQRLDLLESSTDSFMESVPPRVASLESALTALRGISTGARDAWLLAEAEYYMQIANAQLQLAGNPPLAVLALELADERIVELGDPGLTDVRRTLSAEIRSLEVLERPDIEGTTLTLASLSRVVDSLPVRQEIRGEEDDAAQPDAELSGTDRAIASFRNAVSGVVSVRRTDDAARPLMAPESVYFLRANLALQLQAARLSMLRGEQALFQQSLDDAAAWLREYYDTESTPVRSTLQTIGEIRENSFTHAMPDISESLRVIREYMAFIEAARTEADDTDAEPPQ